MSKRSTFSFRLGCPTYLEDLKASRAYKHLRHFGRGIDHDSSAESVFSFDSGCTGNWSMLSDITLGDLSVSQIAVLNLPIDLADVSNPEPFKEPSSTETNSRPKPRRKWSSRGRMHNAIENGNELVIRALLAMGVDIEELDSHGRTPLIHATVKCQEAICKLLLEKGASLGALKAFTSCMDINERSKLLDPLLGEAITGDSRSVTALGMLVPMVLGINHNRSSRSMMNVAIDMNYELAVRTIIHLEPQVLTEVDTDGRTPLVYAAVKNQGAICKLLLERGAGLGALKAFTSCMDINERSKLLDPLLGEAITGDSRSVTALGMLVPMALGINHNRSSRSVMNVAIDMNYELAVRAIIHFEPQVLAEVDTEGRTPLVLATMKRQEAICRLLLEKGASIEALRAFTSGMDVNERSKLLDPLINKAIDDGSRTVTALRLLVLMALGTNYGDDYQSSQSMLHVAIDLSYEVAVCAIIHLEPQVLVGVDTAGRTPLIHAAQLVLNSNIDEYKLLEDIGRVLLDSSNIETVEKMPVNCIAVSMHNVIKRDYKSILVLLSLVGAHDAEGWTPLASAAYNLNEALCEFLVAKGCTLCLDTKQKEQLKPKLPLRIHDAAWGGYKTALQLLLDMGADINEGGLAGETALIMAVSNNNLSCVKILIDRGADVTISSSSGNMLHSAVLKSAGSETMKFLLEQVVEARDLVNAKDRWGNTPLHCCTYQDCQSPVVRLEIAKMLVQAGAALATKNNDGETPYESARFWERKELAKYLWCQLSPKQQTQETPLW